MILFFFFLFIQTAQLENSVVYTYPSVDGTLKVVVTFTSEPTKNYEDIVPELAELFTIEVGDN